MGRHYSARSRDRASVVEVHPGWLSPLLTYPGRLDVSVHVEPIDPATAASRLKQQLAKLEAGRSHTAEHGRLFDPQVEAATEDAYDLSSRVARGSCSGSACT